MHVNPDGASTCAQCKAPLPKIQIHAQAAKDQAPPRPNERAIQFRKDQVIARRYKVLQLVARGGMGAIYRVHDTVLGEDVALKTLLPQFAKDKMIVDRFFNEAKIARRLAHPHIARVHDIGMANSVLYISMEFLAGRSLRQHLENLPAGQRLPLKEILRIFDELCQALEYAHQYTVHRDIKPEDVMVGEDGQVKLMDFGISKLMETTKMTGASVVMGTPFYMAPEQLRSSTDVDARADIFSVGVMLYEVLTGNMPTGIPKPASQVQGGLPPELDAVVTKCVDPDPDRRYPSARALRETIRPIRELIDGQTVVGRPPTGVRVPRGKRVVGIASLIVVLAATAIGVWAMGMPKPTIPETQTELGRLLALVDRARSAAEARSVGSEQFQSACEQGASMTQLARENGKNNESAGIQYAEKALQCYLAPLMASSLPGMAFVPGGEVNVNGQNMTVAPFFIDATEVSMNDFARFCREVDGGWRPGFENVSAEYGGYPVTMVTYYDAAAFAARQLKRLPTRAQWARAAYGGPEASVVYPWAEEWEEGAANVRTGDAGGYAQPPRQFPKDVTWAQCFDMAGNVSEWTRTVVQGAGVDGMPEFGSQLIVCGGSFLQPPRPLTETGTAYFSERAEDLGFRCVREIPTDPAKAKALLDRVL